MEVHTQRSTGSLQMPTALHKQTVTCRSSRKGECAHLSGTVPPEGADVAPACPDTQRSLVSR